MENIKKIRGTGFLRNSKGEVVAEFENEVNRAFYNNIITGLSENKILPLKSSIGRPVNGERFSLVGRDYNYYDRKLNRELGATESSLLTIKEVGYNYATITGTVAIQESGTIYAGGFDIACENNIPLKASPSFFMVNYKTSNIVDVGIPNFNGVSGSYHKSSKAFFCYSGTKLYKVPYNEGVFETAIEVATINIANPHIFSDFKNRIFFHQQNAKEIYIYDIPLNVLTKLTYTGDFLTRRLVYNPKYDLFLDDNGKAINMSGILIANTGDFYANITFMDEEIMLSSEKAVNLNTLDGYSVGGYATGKVNASYHMNVPNTFLLYDDKLSLMTVRFYTNGHEFIVGDVGYLNNTYYKLKVPYYAESGEILGLDYKFTWGE